MTYVLDLSDQNLTSLPDKLPTSLQKLKCFNNKLTSLPDNLPPSLQLIWCYNNQLTSLPDNLPPSLRYIWCDNNNLTSLPNNLPPSLQELYCSNNKLTILPDLPNTLMWIHLSNNPLEANYPLIFTFRYKHAAETIAYVNARNREIRRERMRAIDPTNQILERYMQRMMHPARLAALAQDETLDIDTFMETYVSTL